MRGRYGYVCFISHDEIIMFSDNVDVCEVDTLIREI